MRARAPIMSLPTSRRTITHYLSALSLWSEDDEGSTMATRKDHARLTRSAATKGVQPLHGVCDLGHVRVSVPFFSSASRRLLQVVAGSSIPNF